LGDDLTRSLEQYRKRAASIVTLLAVLALSIGLDYGWKRSRPSRPVPVQVGH